MQNLVHREMQLENEFDQSLPLILIYYRFRGQLQPIRNLFCYLELPFIQIHLDKFEEQKQILSPIILQHIRKFKIDRRMLPVLIHGNLMVEGQFPIVNYAVRRFDRLDLLGANIMAKVRIDLYQARLQEIFQIYFTKQPQSMIEMLKNSDKVFLCKNNQEINEVMRRFFDSFMDSSKYVKQICQMLDIQRQPTYILGALTLIDFFFFQSCSYMIGCFNREERVDMNEFKCWIPNKHHFLNKPKAYYMQIMKRYDAKIKQEPWYIKNREYLQSFSIINDTISPERVHGLRMFWVGNPKFVI